MRMRIAPICVAAVSTAAFLLDQKSGQSPAAPPATSPPAAAADLPEAGTPAAAELVTRALDKMLAYERGAFSTTESRDLAMLRNVGFAQAPDDIVVDGGWQPGMVWGRCD